MTCEIIHIKKFDEATLNWKLNGEVTKIAPNVPCADPSQVWYINDEGSFILNLYSLIYTN